MRSHKLVVLLAGVLLSTPALAQQPNTSSVTLPLSKYNALQRRLEPSTAPPPPVPITCKARSLEGVFRKGLLAATLTARLSVLDRSGHVWVPVLDGGAYPQRALVDGKPTTLVKRRGMYVVGIERPGTYQVKLRFLVGREQDRFARRLLLRLPRGCPTRLSILVPEKGIEAWLRQGALTGQRSQGGGTLLLGNLDASGQVDLSWTRKLTHKTSAVRMEARQNTLFTVREALVSGVAVFDLRVLGGETDRVDLSLPPSVEVIKVSGDAVLQWQTRTGDAGRLTVLLRYLIKGRTQIKVHFSFPGRRGHPLDLAMITLPARVPVSGTVGVQAPTGLNVKVVRSRDARALTLRDLPAELTELTRSPLLVGFSHTRPPRITLAVTRNQQVALTTTLIDEIQAATVITEEGAERTKLKLHIRNNTRQYLGLRLPPGAQLISALIDGQPVHPARAGDGSLLLSLRQSERIDPVAGRVHRVTPGQTLGDIAHFYYSDPSRWTLILQRNKDVLKNEQGLRPGQQLKIPSAGPVKVEESSFVLELSYRRAHDALGLWGSVATRLPGLDVDAMKVAWHLYLPSSVTPLSFDANLTQYTAIRYGPFRRAFRYLQEVFSGRQAWAGSQQPYTSILSRRRSIFLDQEGRKGMVEVAPSSFPLVGKRYRFRRILLSRARPAVSVVYAASPLVLGARWGALLLALAMTLYLLRGRRRWWTWLLAGALTAVLLVAAHYVIGVHRRLVWGVVLALLVALARLHRERALASVKEMLWSPWTLARLVTFKNLLLTAGVCLVLSLVLRYPMMLSLVALGLLVPWWRRRDAARGAQSAEETPNTEDETRSEPCGETKKPTTEIAETAEPGDEEACADEGPEQQVGGDTEDKKEGEDR